MLGKHRQAGDTIVEVLIVVVVLGSILATAYAIASRSIQSTQRSQEHAYALKLAESQLETLNARIATDATVQGKGVNQGFCFDQQGNVVAIGGSSPTDTAAADNYANYGACKRDPNDTVTNSCSGGGLCYYYGLKRVSGNNFAATVRWDGVGGTKDSVQLYYRVYP